jgi:hypothetical protein
MYAFETRELLGISRIDVITYAVDAYQGELETDWTSVHGGKKKKTQKNVFRK